MTNEDSRLFNSVLYKHRLESVYSSFVFKCFHCFALVSFYQLPNKIGDQTIRDEVPKTDCECELCYGILPISSGNV